MLVFSGLGWSLLAMPLVLLGALVAAVSRWRPESMDAGSPLASRIFVVAFLASSVWATFLAIRNFTAPQVATVDPTTGRERVGRRVHSCYWLRAEVWAVLYLAAALCFFFLRG